MTAETEQQQQRELIAGVLGVPVDEVGMPDWRPFAQSGVTVKVSLTYWRAQAAIDLDDLGLPPMSDTEKQQLHGIFKLGNKRLLPERLYKDLEAAARRLYRSPDRYAFKTDWGDFIPLTAYHSWKTDFEAAQKSFFAVRDRIVRGYDENVRLMRGVYTTAARRSWRILNRIADNQALTPAQQREQEEFVSGTVQRILDEIPSAEEIERSFSATPVVKPLPILAEAQGDPVQVTDALEPIRRRVNIDREAARRREEQIAAMNADIQAYATQEKQKLDDFLGDFARHLRTTLYDALLNVVTKLQESDREEIHGNTVRGLGRLTEQLSLLNFYGDENVDTMVARVRDAIRMTDSATTVADLQGLLRNVVIVTRQELQALGETPRSARAIGVADTLPEAELRQAREMIGVRDLAVIAREGRGEREPLEDSGVTLSPQPTRSERVW